MSQLKLGREFRLRVSEGSRGVCSGGLPKSFHLQSCKLCNIEKLCGVICCLLKNLTEESIQHVVSCPEVLVLTDDKVFPEYDVLG
jgi:hypothetical protein